MRPCIHGDDPEQCISCEMLARRQQCLITDTMENLDLMRDLWLYRIKAALFLASFTPHWPQYVAQWKMRAAAECLKVMTAEYLLSQQEELLV